MNNRRLVHLVIILIAAVTLSGCQAATPEGPTLQLLENTATAAETESGEDLDGQEQDQVEAVSSKKIRTVGDLLANSEEKSSILVKQTVTAQAQLLSAILATPEPTEVSVVQEATPAAPPNPAIPAIFIESLAAHNDIRAETGLPPLVWDSEYALASQQWADTVAAQGVLQHDPNADAWENVSQQVAGTSADEIVKSPIFGWANDRERETFAATNGCPFDHEEFVFCGHYRVITDPELTSVGCGVTNGGDWDFWVCRFR